MKKHNFIILLLALLVYIGSILCSGFRYESKQFQLLNFPDSLYAGSESCLPCHKSIYDSFVTTAHNLTSHTPGPEFIKGSFEPGKNRFTYNKFMEVVMENRNGSFYQTSIINGVSFQSEPIEMVIGSGRKGQTYLYWRDNKLLQLPVSYFTPTDSWCNSPGYSLNMIRFDRLINGRCIECHGSYARIQEPEENITLYDKHSIVYGVNCERCHGPAAKHVTFHLENRLEKNAHFIYTKKILTRQQKLDACALCHSGFRQFLKPPFSFVTGDRLTDFSLPTYSEDTSALLDVHGNQYGLLTASKCFKNSEMDCASCHNVHNEEINVPKLYSTRCSSCHNQTSHNTCSFKPQQGFVLNDNCIDCHMPSLASKSIFLQSSDPQKSSPDYVRTHHVAIYPEQTKKFIKDYLEKPTTN